MRKHIITTVNEDIVVTEKDVNDLYGKILKKYGYEDSDCSSAGWFKLKYPEDDINHLEDRLAISLVIEPGFGYRNIVEELYCTNLTLYDITIYNYFNSYDSLEEDETNKFCKLLKQCKAELHQDYVASMKELVKQLPSIGLKVSTYKEEG